MCKPCHGCRPPVLLLAAALLLGPAGASAAEPSPQRRAEVLVELAWLADPELCPYCPSASVEAGRLCVSGYLPSDDLKERALQTARDVSGLPAEDRVRVHRGLKVRPRRVGSDDLLQGAMRILQSSFPSGHKQWRVSLGAHGGVVVVGPAASLEEKLAVSRQVRRLAGCPCVDNRLEVGGGADAASAGTPPGQGDPPVSTPPVAVYLPDLAPVLPDAGGVVSDPAPPSPHPGDVQWSPPTAGASAEQAARGHPVLMTPQPLAGGTEASGATPPGPITEAVAPSRAADPGDFVISLEAGGDRPEALEEVRITAGEFGVEQLPVPPAAAPARPTAFGVAGPAALAGVVPTGTAGARGAVDPEEGAGESTFATERTGPPVTPQPPPAAQTPWQSNKVGPAPGGNTYPGLPPVGTAGAPAPPGPSRQLPGGPTTGQSLTGANNQSAGQPSVTLSAPQPVTREDQIREMEQQGRLAYANVLVQSVLGAGVRHLQVEYREPNTLVVQFEAASENEAERLARSVLNFPGLAQYALELKVGVYSAAPAALAH